MGSQAAVPDQRSWLGRIGLAFVYAVVVILIAAASFNGFYDKWGFRDDASRFSTELMLSGDADRPFVYRRLNAWITEEVAAVTPDHLEAAAQATAVNAKGRSTVGPDRVATAQPGYFWRYNVLYYLTFFEWVTAIAVLASLCARYVGALCGLAATTTFALLFPVLLTIGGYFYDFPEILFFSAAVYAASRGWLIPLFLVVGVGAMNKETMVFFAPTLLPFLSEKYGWRRGAIIMGTLVLLAGAVYGWIRTLHAGNPGAALELHFLSNLRFYANPLNLLAVEKTYGLALFKGYSLIVVLFAGIVAVAGWRAAPNVVRLHAAAAVLVNAPLFVFMAYPGELRNLSLTFVAWTLLAACAIRRWTAISSASPRAEIPA